MGLALLNRILFDSFENRKRYLICSLWSVAKALKFCCCTYTSLGHVCLLSMINYVWSIGYRLPLLQFQFIRPFLDYYLLSLVRSVLTCYALYYFQASCCAGIVNLLARKTHCQYMMFGDFPDHLLELLLPTATLKMMLHCCPAPWHHGVAPPLRVQGTRFLPLGPKILRPSWWFGCRSRSCGGAAGDASIRHEQLNSLLFCMNMAEILKPSTHLFQWSPNIFHYF
jgi:hypothetical protein